MIYKHLIGFFKANEVIKAPAKVEGKPAVLIRKIEKEFQFGDQRWLSKLSYHICGLILNHKICLSAS